MSRNEKDKCGISCIGVEVNEEMSKKAKRRTRKYPRSKVVQGTLVEEEDLDISELSQQESQWLAGDVKHVRGAPNVLDNVFPRIDLLILDGGEFSTYAEFKLLEERLCGWLVLDNTKTRKCQRILREIRLSTKYSLIFESNERNGVAIAKIVGKAKTQALSHHRSVKGAFFNFYSSEFNCNTVDANSSRIGCCPTAGLVY